MQKQQRKQYTGTFKAKVALETIKGQRTVQELASSYGVHPNQITKWKQQLVAGAAEVFTPGNRNGADGNEDAVRAELYQQIGKLQVGIGLVAKKIRDHATVDERRACIDVNENTLSIARQCQLVGLSRSAWYYQPESESAQNLELMRLLDEQYTRTPFYGSRRMRIWLREQGWDVNRKRIQRLMQTLGIQAIYAKPHLSDPAPGHRIYPYLLRGMNIDRVNQVWSTDITYVRLRGGFVYLTAILDWFSRYVLAWEVSTTLDTNFCVSALESALRIARPEIFNSDQGSQFTSDEFTGRLKSDGIRISMDGRGRALDNVFVERLWRTVKYEEVYLNDYDDVPDAIGGLKRYFRFYNCDRPHQALNYRTPERVYFSGA